MNILVTGGMGFIGSHFVEMITSKSPAANGVKFISVVDSLTYAHNKAWMREYVGQGHDFIFAPIQHESRIRGLFLKGPMIDVVVNFAAETHVDRSIKDPTLFMDTNIIGTQNLLEACKENDVPLFVQISTDEVYGSMGLDEKHAWTEQSPLNPRSPYAASKASADLMCKAYHETYGQNVLIIRMSNNYGPGQHPEKFIPTCIRNINERRTIPIYGDGKYTRDWIYVKDAVRGIKHLIDLHLEDEDLCEIYNMAGNCEVQNIDVAKLIIREMKTIDDEKIEPVYENYIREVEDRPGHDRRYFMDDSKFRKATNYLPSFSFEDGIKETIKWYTDK